MSERLYIIHCSNCGYKKLTDGSDLANLVEVKGCKSCSGARRFKCPKCGYLAKASKANTETKTSSQKHMEKLRQLEKLKEEQRAKDQRRRKKDRFDEENRK